jgi:hypothetical protein
MVCCVGVCFYLQRLAQSRVVVVVVVVVEKEGEVKDEKDASVSGELVTRVKSADNVAEASLESSSTIDAAVESVAAAAPLLASCALLASLLLNV